MYKQMLSALSFAVAMQGAALAQEAAMTPLRPDQVEFRALYKELVETNTTLSSGSCTLLAERIAAHLKSAGFTDKDLTLFSVPEHPKEGGLVAILTGSSSGAKPMLLLGTWMSSKPSARTGPAIPSPSSRKMAISMAVVPRT